MFETIALAHGPVKPGDSHRFEFPYSGITIVELQASCGCTDVANKDGKVFATYKAAPVPAQLKQLKQDQYTAQKYVYVTYYETDPKDLKKITLTINAVVKE